MNALQLQPIHNDDVARMSVHAIQFAVDTDVPRTGGTIVRLALLLDNIRAHLVQSPTSQRRQATARGRPSSVLAQRASRRRSAAARRNRAAAALDPSAGPGVEGWLGICKEPRTCGQTVSGRDK